MWTINMSGQVTIWIMEFKFIGLLSDDSKPLLDAQFTHAHLDRQEQTLVKIVSR